jgi:flagellar export protein FliJ
MRQFRFRLDRVLEWRRKKCRIEETRLAACLGLVLAAERKIERLQAERTSIERELLGRAAIPAADLLNLGRYRLRANKEELELTEERRQRMLAAADQRARVQQAQQRVRLLEKLREREFAEYASAAARELDALAADAYLARWPQSRRIDSRGAGDFAANQNGRSERPIDSTGSPTV